jgi:tellurite resistance protein
MFAMLKRAVGGAAKEVKAEYASNKDYLEAVCAAAALVANADGEIEDSEKFKITKLITNHPTLGKLYQQPMIEQTASEMFGRARDFAGRQQLARELDDIKGRPDGAQMAEDIYLVALDIANADGELEPQEDAVLKKIAARLGVDPGKFEF